MISSLNQRETNLVFFLCIAALIAGCGNSNGTSSPGTSGGSTASGGIKGSGGTTASGGASVSGSSSVSGGSSAVSGGASSMGGSTLGGASSLAGSASLGGTSGASGSAGASGTAGKGGAGNAGAGGKANGGANAGGNGGAAAGGKAGGGTGAGGASGGAGGAGGTGGSTGTPPGDIANTAGTPLVAAHSMTRALYAAYSGKLFQARRASDAKTQDINAASAGSDVDLNALNAFCAGTTCSVSILYDQSGNANDLTQAAAANQPAIQYWKTSNGTQLPMAVSVSRQWLRNRTNTHKIPTGSMPQTEYMVVHAAFQGAIAGTNGCCYDYGNVERTIADNGPGTMSALYFGSATDWTRGAGNGPWAMMDFENGLFAGGGAIANLNQGAASVNQSDPSIAYPGNNIAVVLGKTNGTSTFVLKYGNAATGALGTAWSGSLPTQPNPTPYIPLKQEGGLSLGEGGDGSNMGKGAFSEGVVIAAQTSDATDNAIQANLNAVYGR